MEQLLSHYKKEHKDGIVKKQEIVLPPYEFAWVSFDMSRTVDFRKTLRYFFVCYADFECSNIPVQDPSSKRTKISPISPLGRIKPFQKYKPQLKLLEMKKVSNKST
jgi:hypothetical protein